MSERRGNRPPHRGVTWQAEWEPPPPPYVDYEPSDDIPGWDELDDDRWQAHRRLSSLSSTVAARAVDGGLDDELVRRYLAARHRFERATGILDQVYEAYVGDSRL